MPLPAISSALWNYCFNPPAGSGVSLICYYKGVDQSFLECEREYERREGVRESTKGVIRLYCYASVVIIVKRQKMGCTQPSCVPGESW